MAKNTVTTITDDIDGSSNAEEVSFSYNGVDYQIDLGRKNKAALEKALKPYIEAGTKTSRRDRGLKKSATRRDLAEIRAWAKSKGMKVSDRGRMSSEVIEAYEAR